MLVNLPILLSICKGDASAAFEWTGRMTRKKRPWSTKAVADVKALAENGKCVTAKVYSTL